MLGRRKHLVDTVSVTHSTISLIVLFGSFRYLGAGFCHADREYSLAVGRNASDDHLYGRAR